MTVANAAPHPAEEFHFEGPEKKLDITFTAANGGGFRRVPEAMWTEVLKDAKCSILHRKSNAEFDAYLLSESSLFVYENRVIAKTCGQTTLLNLIPHLLGMAHVLGTKALTLSYGHYRYKFPDEQEEPHRNFETERSYLDKIFAKARAATLGADADAVVTRVAEQGAHRCWHVYFADLRRLTLSPDGLFVDVFPGTYTPVEGLEALRVLPAHDEPSAGGYETQSSDSDGDGAGAEAEEEAVLEIAMEGLGTAFASHFFYDGDAGAARAADPAGVCAAAGIAALMPGVELDNWCFEPCGFSLNGQRGSNYFTIHITPEAQMSFASFETNDPAYCTDDFVARLLAVFRPKDATVLVTCRGAGGADALGPVGSRVAGYTCARATAEEFGPTIAATCAVLDQAEGAPDAAGIHA
mmetsp:Transcript_20565/g.60723  ORF Transcript_20565/g.60723 Transcript_20565/m.60723 type:complete len:410 (-) Transcript_20565:289-1518(-)